MKRNSYYDIDKIFLRNLTARDIAEPLPSFDSGTPGDVARSALEKHHQRIAGVRENGFVTGYLTSDELGEGPCGQFCHPINDAKILSGNAHLSELVLTLDQVPFLFVKFLGEISGVVTRADLDDPPLIERRFPETGWEVYISPLRLEKAAVLQEERRRRNQDPRKLDCLQFSDKAQIVLRDEQLRQQAGFRSRRRGEQTIKDLEKLRNNLAHSQDIVSLDWGTIVNLSENLEAVIEILSSE